MAYNGPVAEMAAFDTLPRELSRWLDQEAPVGFTPSDTLMVFNFHIANGSTPSLAITRTIRDLIAVYAKMRSDFAS